MLHDVDTTDESGSVMIFKAGVENGIDQFIPQDYSEKERLAVGH